MEMANTNYDNDVIINFKNFLNSNREKINRITPKNPNIKLDKEWLEEDEWDEIYNNAYC